MSLTLNIIEHELQSFGSVERSEQANPAFADFRLFIDSLPSLDPSVLYLCGARADVEKVVRAGCHALYVSASDPHPDERAALSVLGGQSVLLVFNALLDVAFKYGEWERAMDAVRFQDGDLQDLLDTGSPFLLNNVVILDPALKLLAYTKHVPCDDPITVELISHGYHTEENISKFKLHKRFKPWSEEQGLVINDSREICKYTTAVKTFKTRSSFSIIIVMMCNVAPADGYLLDAFEMFASRVEYFANRDYPDDKPAGNAVDTFLKDLFLNPSMSARAARERGKCLGIPSEARFCLFYIRETLDEVPRSRLLSDVSRLVAPAKTVLVDDAVVVLCFNCRSDRCALHCASNTCPLGHSSLSSRLNEMLARFDLVCGRSSKFTELAAAPTAFKQAQMAYRVGKRRLASRDDLGIRHNWDRIASFDSCAVDFLVGTTADEGLTLVRSTYAGSVLDSMCRQDAAAHTDNYRFLYEYLMSERRASVVAEKLHMHRNNVRYRIDKIEDRYGIDTTDPAQRFDFLLAYRIREASSMQTAQ